MIENTTIRIHKSRIKLYLYFLILFPYPLIERVIPAMDRGFQILQIAVFILCVIEIVMRKLLYKASYIRWVFLFLFMSFISTIFSSISDVGLYLRNTFFPIAATLLFSLVVYSDSFFEPIHCFSIVYIWGIWINALLMMLYPRGVVFSNIGASGFRASWLFGSKNNVNIFVPMILLLIFIDANSIYATSIYKVLCFLTVIVMGISFSSMGPFKAHLLSGSTSSMIIIFLFIFLYFAKKSGLFNWLSKVFNYRSITVVSILLMALVVLSSMNVVHFLDFIFAITKKDNSFSGRGYVWQEGLSEFRNNPIIGIGSKNEIFHIYGKSYSDNLSLYSFWITMIVRYGILGAMMFIGLFFCKEYKKTADIDNDMISDLITMSFCAVMILGLANMLEWKGFVFILMTGAAYYYSKDNKEMKSVSLPLRYGKTM